MSPLSLGRVRSWCGAELNNIRTIADDESSNARLSDPRRVDRDAAVVLLVAALALTAGQFLARDSIWLEHVMRLVGAPSAAASLHASMTTSIHAAFWQLILWVVMQIITYTIPAAIVIRFVLRKPFHDFGLRMRTTGRFALPYALLFAVSVPFLVAVSYASEFQYRYPFYQLGLGERYWPYLWIWWGCYALQFIALEFFFRGFLVHGLIPRFGAMAVVVMVLPYNMLHYGKPMAEAIAAIVGGLVLGTLAIRARTIWWGAALHISIAATMDLLSLSHQHRLF